MRTLRRRTAGWTKTRCITARLEAVKSGDFMAAQMLCRTIVACLRPDMSACLWAF
jgi:hypothetical protein